MTRYETDRSPFTNVALFDRYLVRVFDFPKKQRSAINLNPARPTLKRRATMQPSQGKMPAYGMFNWWDRAANSVERTVAAFLEIGEAVATHWIQTAKGVLLLQMVPDKGASRAIYVFDRQREQWYMLSFESCEDQLTSVVHNLLYPYYRFEKLSLLLFAESCCSQCSCGRVVRTNYRLAREPFLWE